MFIRFIENILEKFPDIETGEFVDPATCLYRWQHVAANRDKAVVYFMLARMTTTGLQEALTISLDTPPETVEVNSNAMPAE